MKLATFEVPTPIGPVTRLGAVIQNGYVDLNSSYATYLNDQSEEDPYTHANFAQPADILQFLKRGETAINDAKKTVAYVEKRLKNSEGKGPRGEKLFYQFSEVKLKAPVPRPPKIISTGLNYVSHIKDGSFKTPKAPAAFIKFSSTVVGSDEPIIYPRTTTKLDYEIELSFVVSKKAKYVSKEKAYDYIAGYSVFNDMSARDLQLEEQKTGNHPFISKNLDTFSPFGPYLVLKDEVSDPNRLEMELKVNGQRRQKINTSEMIFKVHELLSYFSCMTLEPGDVVTCGTPGGVGYFGRDDPEPWLLKVGDVIDASIEKLGTLRNKIVSE